MAATRPFEKNALIVFNPEFESAARAYVQESLQYRELYQHFYMLAVPSKKKKEDAVSEQELMVLLNRHKISKQNTDSFLIVKKEATDWDKDGDEYYDDIVLSCVKKFKKHAVIITYDYYLGEKKFSTLGRIRHHKGYTSSHGFPQGTIVQAPLYNEKNVSAKPPFTYLCLTELPPRDVKPFSDDEKKNYQQAIEGEIALRQQKIYPIVCAAEEYPNPNFIAEKLANLFTAFVAIGDLSVEPSQRQLANDIALELRYQSEWELEDCLRAIKTKVDQSSQVIHPKGTFQGLLSEIINMMHSTSIFDVGDELRNSWQEKYNELWGLKADLSTREIKNCIDDILQELQELEAAGKPYLVLLRKADAAIHLIQNPSEATRQLHVKMTELENLKKGLAFEDEKNYVGNILQEIQKLEEAGKPPIMLLRAVEATVNLVRNPSEEACQTRQLKIAREIGQHSWGRILAGLSLCLLGVCLGVGIGLTIYFTGGIAALLGAPLVVKGVVLSATFINIGAAIIAGAVTTSIPSVIGAVCLFGKQPIRKNMEGLAEYYQANRSLASQLSIS